MSCIGVKQGVSEFGITLASESLNLGSKVASGSQMMLELTDDFLNLIRPDTLQTSGANRRQNHPESCADGLQQGFNSLQRESGVAYKHLFVLPVEAYQTVGASAGVNALVHAIPIAVLRPMIGIAEGAKHVGLGARNQMAPRHRSETNLIYKS